ncbi:hypothetical protein CDAR_480451 [Caerostris darwini]|uniref:Uncharacterized protein n=1 Tax=Caerostris darwini TaxID=1538125 RepID=A0AAV4V0D0_9ARAC|nr:hypothetical protein CDAR_480451 [Caerostris darwini]
MSKNGFMIPQKIYGFFYAGHPQIVSSRATPDTITEIPDQIMIANTSYSSHSGKCQGTPSTRKLRHGVLEI